MWRSSVKSVDSDECDQDDWGSKSTENAEDDLVFDPSRIGGEFAIMIVGFWDMVLYIRTLWSIIDLTIDQYTYPNVIERVS